MQLNMNTVNTLAPEMTVLAHDHRTEAVAADARNFRVVRRPNLRIAGQAQMYLFLLQLPSFLVYLSFSPL